MKKAGKKKLAFLLSATTLMTTAFACWQGTGSSTVYADPETQTYYFAEGFGTGVDFDSENNSWNIETNFSSGVGSSISDDSGNQAAIVENNHSGQNEPIIRLINGVENADLNSKDSDYRAGTAITKNKVLLKDTSEFSAKFTISMPDACVNKEQTRGDDGSDHSREVGGDGIAFIITTNDSVNGQAGGGIGYYGVSDSIVVELDSYFNGAYCTFETSDTAYINWGYDNQIYSNPDAGYTYLYAVQNSKYTDYSSANNYGAYWDQVLNPNGYKELPASSVRRFDHVGVMLDGKPTEHLGISYLNNLIPNEIKSNIYENIKDPSASVVSSRADCATRFADEGDLSVAGEGVDNRLFTFWVEYDGTNLYVSYANGNFLTAVRPSSPQISVKNDARLDRKFAEKEVYIGFTSAIGSSKANHTVHSVEFVNKYLQDGIQNTEYTEKYYVETPDAISGYITVGTKKYVLTDTASVTNVALGSSVEIRDKSGETKYAPYEKADYSSNPLYPEEVDCVRADGQTVLYQFYDIKPTYKVEYYLEQDAAAPGAVLVNGKYYVKQEEVLESAASGSSVVSNQSSDKKAGVTLDGTAVTDTYKSYTNYEYTAETTAAAGYSQGTVASGSSLVIQLYYDKKITSYTEKYYIENDNPTGDYIELTTGGVTKKYQLEESNTVTDVVVGSGADITDLSGTEPYNKYNLIPSPNGYPDSTTAVLENGTTVLYQIYSKIPVYTYTVKYYVEMNASEADAYSVKIGDKYYNIKSAETVTKSAAEGTVVSSVTNGSNAGVKEDDTDVTDTFKQFAGYTFNQAATDENGKESGSVSSDNSLVIELFYDLNPPEKTEYKEQYWIEAPDAVSDYVEIEVNGEIKKFVLSESNDITDVNVGIGATVTDKSMDYSNYELIEVEIPGYPSSVGEINPDGTTIVHQIYVLKPTYQIEYWVEVPDKTDEAIEINGKYYVVLSEETLTKYASAGILIQSSENADGAGVKEDDTDITDTFKQFAGYVYNQEATDENGYGNGEVMQDGSLVIMLLYDLPEEPTTEEPTTEEPATEEPTTEEPTTEEPTTPEETTTLEETTTPEVTTPETTTKKDTEPTKTGDSMNMTFVVLLLISGCTAFGVIVSKRKREEE